MLPVPRHVAIKDNVSVVVIFVVAAIHRLNSKVIYDQLTNTVHIIRLPLSYER